MNTASRRIFWHSFQAFLKKTRFSASVLQLLTHQIYQKYIITRQISKKRKLHFPTHQIYPKYIIFQHIPKIHNFPTHQIYKKILTFQPEWTLIYAPSSSGPWGIICWYSQSLKSLILMSFWRFNVDKCTHLGKCRKILKRW